MRPPGSPANTKLCSTADTISRKLSEPASTIYISQTDRDALGHLIELVRSEGDRSNVSYVNNSKKTGIRRGVGS